MVNVVDAANLERNLYLTVQLLEMGVPVVLALNMMDVARKRGIQIDTGLLAQELGCPVVPIVAVNGEGTTELKARMLAVADGREQGGFSLALDEVVEQAVADLEPEFGDHPAANRRWLIIKLIEGDDAVGHQTPENAARQSARLAPADRQPRRRGCRYPDRRYPLRPCPRPGADVSRSRGTVTRTLSDRIDRFVLGKWCGIPLFLGIMYLMFLFTINIGGAFIDFFDGTAGALFVSGFGELLTGIGAPDWLRVLLADGLGGGVQVVATFHPDYRLPVPVPVGAGRLRLHGARGLRHGPLHARHRLTG